MAADVDDSAEAEVGIVGGGETTGGPAGEDCTGRARPVDACVGAGLIGGEIRGEATFVGSGATALALGKGNRSSGAAADAEAATADGGDQPAGGTTSTKLPHLGHSRISPMTDRSRTASRALHVVQAM